MYTIFIYSFNVCLKKITLKEQNVQVVRCV